MIPFKYVILAICFTNGIMTAVSQEKKQSSSNSLIFEDLPVANAQRNSILGANENPKDKISRNVFVKAKADKASWYFGEAVRVKYELFTALQTKSVISQRPSLNGASGEDLKLDEAQSREETVNGKKFQVFTILQIKLKPFQPGELIIDPIEVNNSVQYTGDDGKPHGYSGPIKSNPVKIQILALPEKNKPPSFSGIVGKFQIQDVIEKSSFPEGENNNLHVEIAGRGEYEDINPPAIAWPTGFDHFALRETMAGDKSKTPAQGKKVFDIPFTVNQSGNTTFPSIVFTYFDRDKKEYAQTRTEPILLTVLAVSTKKAGNPVVEVRKKITPVILWIAAGLLSALFIAGFVFIRMRKNEKARRKKLAEEAEVVATSAPVKQVDFRKEWDRISANRDGTGFLENTKDFLTRLLQAKLDTTDMLEEDLLKRIQHTELEKYVRRIYSCYNRLLYAPAGMESEWPAISSDMDCIMDLLNIPAGEPVLMDV